MRMLIKVLPCFRSWPLGSGRGRGLDPTEKWPSKSNISLSWETCSKLPSEVIRGLVEIFRKKRWKNHMKQYLHLELIKTATLSTAMKGCFLLEILRNLDKEQCPAFPKWYVRYPTVRQNYFCSFLCSKLQMNSYICTVHELVSCRVVWVQVRDSCNKRNSRITHKYIEPYSLNSDLYEQTIWTAGYHRWALWHCELCRRHPTSDIGYLIRYRENIFCYSDRGPVMILIFKCIPISSTSVHFLGGHQHYIMLVISYNQR